MVLFKQAAKLGDMLSMIHIALHLMQAKNYKEAKKRLNMVINAHTNALMVDVEFIQAGPRP